MGLLKTQNSQSQFLCFLKDIFFNIYYAFVHIHQLICDETFWYIVGADLNRLLHLLFMLFYAAINLKVK